MAEGFMFHADEHDSQEEAFDAYRRLYSNGADVVRGSGRFFATVRARRFDKLLLFDRWLSGASHARVERIKDDGFDHFTLTYLLEGRITVQADARTFALQPGEAVLLDMRRTMRSEAQDARFITVSVMRTLIEAAVGFPARLHGHVLDRPAMGLLGDYLLSLIERSDTLADASYPAVVRIFTDHLAIAIGAGAAHGAPTRRTLVAMQAAEAFIAREIARPDLNADDIAKALGLSRASLYRLFAGHGGVARQIALRRLSLIRLRLEAGDRASLERMALEAGFKGEREARRSFQVLEDVDPDIYRKTSETSVSDVDRSRLRWAAWMNDV